MNDISRCILGLFLLFSTTNANARNAADVVFYHYRATLNDSKVDQFPLFPQEEKIKNFPTPASQNETDLAILQRYYKDLAVAYGNYLRKEIQPKLSDYKRKISNQQQNISLSQSRSLTGKSKFSRSLTEGRGKVGGENHPEQAARIKAISYYSAALKRLSDSAASVKKKAAFYQELSETSEELYRGEIH